MIEAVGEALLADVLRARSTACSRRAAGSGCRRSRWPHDRMLATRRSYTLDPQVRVPRRAHPVDPVDLATTCAAHTALSIVERRDLGAALRPHARALAGAVPRQLGGRWRARFDDTFRRMWEFYLAYCEAGFRVGYLGVSQLGLARAPVRRRLTWRSAARGSGSPAPPAASARRWPASSPTGAPSVAISARSADKLREVAGGRMHVEPLDVTDRAATVAAGAAVRDGAGRPRRRGAQRRHLVAVPRREHVGQRGVRRPAADNLMGTVHALEAVVPTMLAEGAGRIVGHRVGRRLPRASPARRPTGRRRRRC